MIYMHTGVNLDEREIEFVGRMMPDLDEAQRRRFLARYADSLGYGSAKELSRLTGVSEHTISAARKEIREMDADPRARPKGSANARIRAEGGGRKSLTEKDPELADAIQAIVDPCTAGDPMRPLRWTTKSLRTISAELTEAGHPISHVTAGKVLEELGYSLQQNRKYMERGEPGPDRDAQFQFINAQAADFMARGLPVISVDAKKKELVGNYANGGAEYRPKGDPRLVLDHDFEGDLGKAVPYGIFDIGANEGFVNVGIGADTAEFAVNSISSWWYLMGRERYPDAKEVMITADCGGSNGYRLGLWKAELQMLADMSGMTFRVRHLPPGTSKWNKIEHRLFSFISMNWRGVPLESYETIVSLIGSTTNSSDLRVKCVLDTWDYEKGRRAPYEVLETLNIERDEWHGEWNYTIAPRP